MRIASLPDGQVGHIHISGENVTRGYYENPEANSLALTADGWLRTGDLGVVYEGELYITGRAKEIIFVNGQNYYPQDLESIAQQVGALELGKVVAAGVRLPNAQTDHLVVFVLHRASLREFRADRGAGCARDQRAGGTGSMGGRSCEAHSEDHQRQDSAPPP